MTDDSQQSSASALDISGFDDHRHSILGDISGVDDSHDDDLNITFTTAGYDQSALDISGIGKESTSGIEDSHDNLNATFMTVGHDQSALDVSGIGKERTQKIESSFGEDMVGSGIGQSSSNQLEFGELSPIPNARQSMQSADPQMAQHSLDPEARLEAFMASMYPGRDKKEQYRELETLIANCNAFEDKLNDQKLYRNIAEDVVGIIGDKDIEPRKRIHLLAILTKHMRKSDAERITGRSISHDQWFQANIHRDIHEIGLPSEDKLKINHRRHIEEQTIQEFVEWLNSNDYLQNLAYGEKVVTMSNGYHIAIESVKRTDSITNIIRNYYRDFLVARLDGEEENRDNSNEGENMGEVESIPNTTFLHEEGEQFSDYEDENEGGKEQKISKRCSKFCKTSKLRCFLNEHSDGTRHKYTPPDLLSPSTITRVLLELTSGKIKSLAGLDNIDVIKGGQNFENMTQLVDIMVSVICSDDAKEKGEAIKKQIKKVREFHQVDFARHLEAGNCKCMCIKCGLCCEKVDQIECKSMHKHDPPCKHCQETFEILTDMSNLRKEAERAAEPRYQEMPALEDDVDNWKAELNTFLRNLIDYRAHLVHKHSEAEFDSAFYSELDFDEAVVICDWKMKILASKHREAQSEWFSKRGMSLLGFEIHLRSKEDNTRKVFYHFFVTDDTTQDSEAVLCAKHYLYTEILPKYGVKKVKFRSDGAMCFSSKEAKAFMAYWDDIAKSTGGAYETSYKVSVAGCGKTALDGAFGVLTMHLARLVSYGHKFQSSRDIYDLLEKFPLQHSFIHLMKPQRKKLPLPAPSNTSHLSNFHLIKYDSETKTAAVRYYSQYSLDIIYDADKKEGLKRQLKTGTKSQPLNLMMKINCKDHIMKTTFSLEKKDNVPAAIHSNISDQERKIKKERNNMLNHNLKLKLSRNSEETYVEGQGIFCCPIIHAESQCRCLCRFGSKSALDKHATHTNVNIHKFPKSSTTSWVHELHLSGKFAFSLAIGSRKNRSTFINAERQLNTLFSTTYPASDTLVDDTWYKNGCYRKHQKPPFYATEPLKADLEVLFLEGFQKDGPKQGKNKYTPEQAYLFLKNLKLVNGRRKYSNDPNNKENGSIPSITYIQGWFSRRKSKMAEEERKRAKKRAKEVASTTNDQDNVEFVEEEELWPDTSEECNSDNELFAVVDLGTYDTVNVKDLKYMVTKRLSMKKFSLKPFYTRLLENDDFLNKNKESIYIGRRESDLIKLCQDRNLPSSVIRKSLVYFLLHDDKVKRLKKCSPELQMMVIQQRVLEEEAMTSS